MQKRKIINYILIFVFCIFTFFSFSVSNASTITFDGVSITEDEVRERLNDMQTNNPFEMTVSGIALEIGDFILDYTVFLFRDEITIDRLVFNKILSLNANFFDMNKKGIVPDTTEVLCNVINGWYSFFRGLAIIVYLIVLITVGIRIMLGTPDSKAKVHDLVVKWTIGIAILFLFPYVMKYSFRLNEGIVETIRKQNTNSNAYEEIVGTYIGSVSNIQFDEVFEERSPEYISRNEYVYSVGSEEATIAYFKQLEKYQSRGDLMRIMRALAGITAKFIYVALWFIMMWQMLVLLFVYLKRYLMIAFLMIVFPIVVVEYIIGAIKTGKGGSGFSSWCMEFFLNVFIQSVHAVTYGLIGGVVTAHVQNGIMNGNVSKMNWVILIIAVNFIFEAETILKNIIKANAKSMSDASSMGEILKPKNIKNKVKSIFHF